MSAQSNWVWEILIWEALKLTVGKTSNDPKKTQTSNFLNIKSRFLPVKLHERSVELNSEWQWNNVTVTGLHRYFEHNQKHFSPNNKWSTCNKSSKYQKYSQLSEWKWKLQNKQIDLWGSPLGYQPKYQHKNPKKMTINIHHHWQGCYCNPNHHNWTP